MNLPLLRGRDVGASDEETMLVSRSAATLLWGDADPIGRRVTLPLTSRTVLRTVVGIVGDVKQSELTNPAAPTVYQYSRPRTWSSFVLVMKAAVDPHSLAGPATAAIHAIDPERPVEGIQTMDEVLDETLASRRFTVLLLGGFATTALLLASIGIYSVLSHLVRGRLREIGIRTALGARSGDVVRLVISEGMLPTVAGIVAGVGGTLLSARLLDRLVFGVSSTDPWTIAAVVVALAGAALVASLAPAYRASRVDPLRILRAS
jgi:putative ABC transport system permease protein